MLYVNYATKPRIGEKLNDLWFSSTEKPREVAPVCWTGFFRALVSFCCLGSLLDRQRINQLTQPVNVEIHLAVYSTTTR